MSQPSATSPDVRVYPDAAALARAGADMFVDAARHAIGTHGRFFVALSGGSTPRALFQLLAAAPYRDAVEWAHTLVFWGDERCVPPDHPDSNYRMARDALLAHIPIPRDQVFRMPGEATDPTAGAALYEQTVRRAFALGPHEDPRFDLVLLGMGPDGHTASLFPHTAALHVTNRLVVANRVEKLDSTRLTLTTRALNNAALVAFLVAGPDKAEALAGVLEGPPRPDDLPAQMIVPTHGHTIWLVDQAAAAHLTTLPG